MSCKVYGKQYVGSTTERNRLRWNNYKSCQRKAEREGNTVCENISIITSKVRVLKLFLLIRLAQWTLPEERNSGEIDLGP